MKSLAELAAIRARMMDQVNLRKDDNVDTRVVRETVAPIPLDHPEISAWIKECLYQEITELHGGLLL